MQLAFMIALPIAILALFVCAIGASTAWYRAVPSTSDWQTVYNLQAMYRRRMWLFIAGGIVMIVAIITIYVIATQNGWNIYPTEI